MAMSNDLTSGGPAAPTAPVQGPPGVSPQSQSKLPEAQAGYMELQGATKDGDCSKVDVQGGVSLDKGCCNYFEPQDATTDAFSCGNCKYGSEQAGAQNDTGGNPQGMQDNPLKMLRAKPKGMMGL